MSSISLEDRIRELCGKVVGMKDFDHLDPILPELRAALEEPDSVTKELIAERKRMLKPNVDIGK